MCFEDYRLPELISDVAGVLGILLGASVLSLIEFLYAFGDLGLHWLTKGKSSVMA